MHHLLRACADGCRVNHLLRASNSYAVQEKVHESHEAVMAAFMDFSGIALSGGQRVQCLLPIRSGGCGIKGAAQLQPSARIAALAGFYTRGARRVGVPEYASKVDSSLVLPVLSDLASRMGTNYEPLPAWLADHQLIGTSIGDHCLQRWWASAMGGQAMRALIDTASSRDQARLLEQRSGLGSTWMNALPQAHTGSVFSTADYCVGLKWWLGAPLHGCGHDVDPEGDHFLCCVRNNFAPRHDAVQDALFTVLSSSGVSVQREVALPSNTDDHLRPADLLLDNWHAGAPTAVDVTVSHGWGKSLRAAKPPRDNWRPFLAYKEKMKHDKYDLPCKRDGWNFSAVAFGTWGGIGPEGAKVLSRIMQRTTAWEGVEDKGAAQRRNYEAVGTALFRQIWRLLDARNHVS